MSLDASMPPYKIYELPHVIGMVLATPDQIERLMAPYKPAKIETGMRVQVLRGDYAGLYGRIRRIIGNGNEVIASSAKWNKAPRPGAITHHG